MTTTGVVEKPQEPEQQPTPPAPKQVVSEFEDDDMVTVLHRNWGATDPHTHQPFIPMDRETYLDRITFVGGVARNVPYEQAKKWVKLGLVAKAHIFANNAQKEDFERATGRTPMSPGNLAEAVAALSVERALTLLGDEKGMEFAKNLQRLISSRKKEAEDGTR